MLKETVTMKNSIIYNSILLSLILLISSCSRDEDDLVPASFPSNPEVFLDGFTGGLEYCPFAGSKLDAFTVDTETKFEGAAAMRFDIPNEGDPDGSFGGASFKLGSGRDLTGYNALTFWAKGSQAGTINEIGFGNDFGENLFLATLQGLQLTTNWRKYVIPIPDASKLVEEQGMLWYSEAPEDDKGYTFWLDEVQFENLETITNQRAQIAGGTDVTIESFIGVETPIGSLSQTVTLESENEITTQVAPAYFTFASSKPEVATVSSDGVITVVGGGTTKITATLKGRETTGSVTINSLGEFEFAPEPTEDPSNVISIFSDSYENRGVDYFNGFWAFSTTKGGNNLEIGGDNLIVYSDLNFVGIQFSATVPTIDASEMTHFHVDIFTAETIDPDDFLRVGLVDIGPDNSFGGGDDSGQELTYTPSDIVTGEWLSLDIPLSDFAGLTSRSNLAQVVFVSDGTISSIIVDNIYLYRDDDPGTGSPQEPEVAAPTPSQDAANVISLFSDAYNDVIVDTWRTDWSAASFEDVVIADDSTKKYSNLDFVGIETVSNPVDASNMTHIHMDLWSPDFTLFGIKLVDFGADGAFGGDDDSEQQIDFDMPMQGDWVSLDIPLDDFAALTGRSSIAQYILVGQPTGSTTLFVDNMFFYADGGGMGTPQEPDQAAPIPMQDAANVISLFSDAYEDVIVDTWRTDWSATDFEDVTIADDPTKKYSNLDFVGIETVSSPVDASNMTHIHLDIWSPDFTLFGIKLVDFGADGAFGGDDDSEQQLDFDMPMQGDWVSLDIPLDDFAALTGRSSIAQYILVGQPTGMTTVFVDNFYFYQRQ